MATFQRGRKAIAAPIEIGEVRTLKRADLAVLQMPRPAAQIQNLRDTHHRVARAVAAGLSDAEVAQLTGRSIVGIQRLRADAAFKDLVAHKRAMIDAEFAASADPVIDYMKQNALKAAAMLSDKIDAAAEADEFLPTRDLVAIQELGFDRTGYGKVNKNVNINVDFAAQLEAARKRSAGARRPADPRVIEARPPAPQSGPVDNPSAPRRSVPPPPNFRRM